MGDQPKFSLLYAVSDLPPQIFAWLDPSSLALAACVCRAWRDLARNARGSSRKQFRLVLADLLPTVSTLAWVVENLNEKELPPRLCARVCRLAAKGGHLEGLKWARKNGYLWDADTCANAAAGGYLGVLMWAREHGCNWDAWTCACAALGGHLDVLQWARKNGCKWNKHACANAAKGGHLVVLQWARQNGCEWDAWTCASAAQGGHLEVLKWAWDNGCPREKVECQERAILGGYTEMAAWIASQPE